MKLSSLSLSFSLSLTLAALTLPAQESEMGSSAPSEDQLHFFEKEIRPALIKHCYECHSHENDKIKGNLALDTREDSYSGGDTGPAVVPYAPEESLLLTAIRYQDPDLEMPPKYQLEPDLIAKFETWIKMGAVDPREKPRDGQPIPRYTNTIDLDAGQAHWAYQVPQLPELSQVVDGDAAGSHPIDILIAKGYEDKDLSPVGEADPRTLFRRLSFDLTGLPPRPRVVEAFVRAYQRDPDLAIRDAVGRLLSSESFGERWGRHWLDVARYAESTGKEINATYPHAWRYRDYVIDAFNADKPFNQFLIEQIAGDLLPANNDRERADQLIATGFLALGTKGLNEPSARQFRFDLVDEQIDTTTQVFLATTAACARCHDHKSDPIPMADYYALAGIFLSSETLFGTATSQQNRRSTDLLPLPSGTVSLPGLSLAEMIDLDFQRELLRESLRNLREEAAEARRRGDSEGATQAQAAQLRILTLTTQLGLVEAKIANYDIQGNTRPLALGMRDHAEPFDSQILIRGEERLATEERVPRGVLQVIRTPDAPRIPAQSSGRLELAQWMASPENPLTARVIANRVWLWLFGEGLVATVDNFGPSGEKPTHPELLDYLALRLVELDWSIKGLIREITLSHTYRLASSYQSDNFEKDPENRMLWRAHPRRLDAEALRDATLAVSGQLTLERPLGSLVAQAGIGFVGRTLPETSFESESTHRSVYLPIVRGAIPDSLSLFDFSDPSLTSGKRESTNVPSQALYQMNSPFILQAADHFAQTLLKSGISRGPQLTRYAFYRAFSRPPTEDELVAAQEFMTAFLETAKAQGMPLPRARSLALATFCQSLLASAEFSNLN